MAKRKEKKKKLKSLVLLLFLTIVLLSTSTYAWFTANRSVTIDPINVRIAASSGLQISTDATEWKTLISNTDITTPTNWSGNTNQLPSQLAPVSTNGSVTSGYLNFYKGTVEGIKTGADAGKLALTAVKSPAEAKGTTGDFIAFDIFLKVDDEAGADIYLENGSGVKVKAETTDKGLQYAARYAFVIEGNVPSTSTAAAAQALMTGNSSIVVEPNYDAHKASGTNNASLYYGLSTTTAASGVAAVPYLGVKAAISTPIVLLDTNPGTGGTPSSTYFESVPTLYRTNVAYSDQDEEHKEAYKGSTKETNLLNAFHLSTGITKIRVYMWIEGQDVDCENSASGSDLTYKLGFSLDDGNETQTP